MPTTKLPEAEPSEPPEAISADADLWIRRFIQQFELHVLDASRNLPPGASISNMQSATARAILATYLASGLAFESALELLGQVAVGWRSQEVAWSDAARRNLLPPIV